MKSVGWPDASATLYCSAMPEYTTGEMYYYTWQEMVPFSPYVLLEPFEIEEGKTYKFDFKPTAIEITSPATFESNENTVLTYKVTDGFGNVLTDIWNLLNKGGVHNPLESKEYPFRDKNGNPVDHHYPVDVYLRIKGESRYKKMSFTDFSKANLGKLAAGEYEGYMEINFDTYLDEYVVEYPMEKGVYYNEWQGELISVYDNVDRVLRGVLQKDFTFTVAEQTHTCEFGDWVDDIVTETHTRTCKDSTCGKTETEEHTWDAGVVKKEATATETGIKTYRCTSCSATRQEVIPTTESGGEPEPGGHEHSYSKEWSHNQSGHWHQCACGEKKDEARHDNSEVVTAATASANGKRVTKCKVCGTVTATKTIPRISSIKLSTIRYTYSGTVKSPSLIVKDSTGKTIASTNYFVLKSNDTITRLPLRAIIAARSMYTLTSYRREQISRAQRERRRHLPLSGRNSQQR